MIKCQSHQDLNYEHKTKHRKVLLWGNTLVSVIIKACHFTPFNFKGFISLCRVISFFEMKVVVKVPLFQMSNP